MMTSSLFKKIVRSDILALSFFVVLFHLICSGSVCSGADVKIDCDQLLSKEGLNNIDKDSIMEIQEILKQRGYYKIEIDGKAGRKTRSALEKYCAESKEIYTLTEKELEELPDEIIKKPKILQDVAYPNEQLFTKALREITGLTDDQHISLVVEKARKEYAFSKYKDTSVNWRGASCGCVLEDLSGVVYGFYPFWLAGEEQALDFSVLSRIGYYELALDERGNIVESLSWNKDSAAFINTARDHRTKVDLVVHVDKWKEWCQLDWGAFQEVTDNMAGLITKKLPNRLLNRIKPFITFGGTSVPPIGDGITLSFQSPKDGDDGDARHFFVTFIRDLRKKLEAAGEDYGLNIMLPMEAIGEGLYTFDNFKRLIPDKEKGEEGYEDKNYVDYFLVFLEEPTTDTKKKLRQKIEEHFKGTQRMIMLRKIIPVITPTGHDEQQLKDDLIYFGDNFGGVGIWPLPLMTGQEGAADDITAKRAQVINTILKEGKAPVTDICKFVCPKRWYFRIAWDMSLAILAVLCLSYFISCKVRYISCYYPIYTGIILAALLLPSILLFVTLLECDPYRSFDLTDRVTIIGGVVYVAAVVILVQLFRRKGEQP